MSAMAELADQLDQHLQGARTIARLVYGDEGDQYVADRLNELMAEGAPPPGPTDGWEVLATGAAVTPDGKLLGYVGVCTCGWRTPGAAARESGAGMLVVTHARIRHGGRWRWTSKALKPVVLPEITVTSGTTESDKPGE